MIQITFFVVIEIIMIQISIMFNYITINKGNLINN